NHRPGRKTTATVTRSLGASSVKCLPFSASSRRIVSDTEGGPASAFFGVSDFSPCSSRRSRSQGVSGLSAGFSPTAIGAPGGVGSVRVKTTPWPGRETPSESGGGWSRWTSYLALGREREVRISHHCKLWRFGSVGPVGLRRDSAGG